MPHSESFSDVQGSRVFVHYAVRGHLLNDATQSGIIGISKVTEADMPPITRADGAMELYTDGQEIKLKGEGMQTTYAAIKRAILLSQAMLTCCIRYGADWYNFQNPYDLGLEVTLDVSATDIILTYDFHGKCFPTEWLAVLAAHTGMAAGITGGSSISGLATQAFDDAEYGTPGLVGVYVGTGDLATDDELGLKEAAGSKFQVKVGVSAGSTMRLQPISRRVTLKNEIALFENRVSTVSRNNAYANTEKVITYVFNDSTIVLSNCTKFASGPSFKDASGLYLMKNEGSTYLDPVNGTPTNVIFDDGSKTITFYKQIA